jgi:dsRNA-specific ribonuclease
MESADPEFKNGSRRRAVRPSAILDVLEALLSAGSEEQQAMETYHVQQFIERLQAEDQV